MANIEEEIIREILANTDIVDILSGHLALQPSGKNYRALCPFHSEKTPSFLVSREKQIYHCFGCGEGGNALTFLMKYEKFTFPEAIRYLGERAGIKLPEKRHAKGNGTSLPKLDLYEVNRLACEFYEEQLRRSSEGRRAGEYLKAREIREDCWNRFRLGYAPSSWESLFRHLRGKGKGLPLLEASGLVVQGRQQGAYFDRFRDRLMIPILDAQERIVGFGARALAASEGESKYINSATSPIYNKGESLYGLNSAYKRIREEGFALIVEGYFDLISMHLFGWENTVASLGTSLTSGQARLLRRYGDSAVLLFDSDPAGIRASERSVEVLLEEGFSVKVARLPMGHDPDSLLRDTGRTGMEEVLRNAWDWLDFIWRTKGEGASSKEVGEQIRKARSVLSVLSKVNDRLACAKYIRILGEKAALPEDVLLQEMKEFKRKGAKPTLSPSPCPKAYPAEERQALEIALLNPGKRDRWAELLDPSDITDIAVRRAFSLFCGYGPEREGELRQLLCQESDEDVRNLCIGIWAKERSEFDNPESAFADCVRRIRDRRERLGKQELREKMQEAERRGDSRAVDELIKEHPSLRNRYLHR